EFRDRLGIGRKRSIQILEHFDRIGLTLRTAGLKARGRTAGPAPPASR
ncbi:SelB C-terminal domain-containing protein, partial [Pseudomonas aeruginosa]|nr:SelB C-terminal domain-containing protein [Pseudomonas aeruginosa]